MRFDIDSNGDFPDAYRVEFCELCSQYLISGLTHKTTRLSDSNRPDQDLWKIVIEEIHCTHSLSNG